MIGEYQILRNIKRPFFVVTSVVTFAFCNCAHSVEHNPDWASRVRYGAVNEDGDNGQAVSILLRGNIRSDWSEHLQTLIEVDHVSTAFQDQHSDGVRFNHQPLIPDPPSTEINQAWLDSSWSFGQLRLGRQRIEFDDGRFIGGDGFWQNEQTFDALRLKHTWGSASTMDYVYVDNVNRIYGQQAKGNLGEWILKRYAHNGSSAIFLGDQQQHTHLMHVDANEWDNTKLSGFAYLIDNLDWPTSSNRTVGGRYQHFSEVASIKTNVDVGLAIQDRPEILGNPKPKYGSISLGGIYNAWRLVMRFENLGEDDNIGFVTPLASLNNFQGWSEQFITTPVGGLEDSSIELNWRRSPWELDVRCHQFKSSANELVFGHELDWELTFKPKKDHKVSLRYAKFNGQQDAWPDANKMYLDYSYHLKGT